MSAPSVVPLSLEQARALYYERMTDDFPPDELKPFSAIEASLAKNQYICIGYRDDTEILAYAYFYKYESWALLDYYAVRRDLRDEGYGSRFLKDLIAHPPEGAEAVIVEVEEPDTAEDADERQKRERRLRFYLKNGLWDTGVNAIVYGVNYRLLALPLGQRPDADAVREIYAGLYRSMLPRAMYEKWISI